MSEEEKVDVCIVGAGPAGATAALILARAGLDVMLFERGRFPGAKNVMGGIFYRQALESILPEQVASAPLERPIAQQRVMLMEGDSTVEAAFRDESFAKPPYNSFSVLRAVFDKWYAEQAEAAGAFLINETTVESLLWEDGKVVGVRTGRADGDMRCDVVIAADGVNSLLAKEAKLHPEWKTDMVALAVKEIIELDQQKIEDRFNLENGEGAACEFITDLTRGGLGLGFLYTNMETVSLGIGVLLSDVVAKKLNPNDLIEAVKLQPGIRRYIAGGETREYLAHLIPEGGYRAVPPVACDGMLLAGDAAMLVNSLHREGSNLAVESGRLAAQTVLEAKKLGDYSAAGGLSSYQKKLAESFVMKDLYKYRDFFGYLHRKPKFLSEYPGLVMKVLREALTVDGEPKRDKQKRLMKEVKRVRGPIGMAMDMWGLWRKFRG
jgi:electron transfer flavoprotein-quinone oxidoreductase